ncbi:hypothetical protein HDU97_007077 [Phlyctochytrium planicorne]|nr:hypothetical protein HDU97_007077 [Phlyctochytrium planicorne]
MSNTPVTVKVAYTGSLRTLKVTDETTWLSFEQNVRRLHSIPLNASISVSYTDSDGDRISLDTDQELSELIRQTRASAGTSIRFEVTTAQGSPNADAAFVLVGQGQEQDRVTPPPSIVEEPVKPAPAPVEIERPATAPASTPASEPSAKAVNVNTDGLQPYNVTGEDVSFTIEDVNEDEEDEKAPSYSEEEKGKAREDPGEGSSKSGKNQEEEPRKHFEQFAENIEPLLEELRAEFERANFGPIFEKISTEAKTHLEPALQELFGQFQQENNQGGFPFFPFAGGVHPGFGGFRRGGCGPRSGSCGPKSGSCGPRSGRRGPRFASEGFRQPPWATDSDKPWPPKWFGVVCDSCDAKSFSGARFKCQECPDYDLCAGCYPSRTIVHGDHGFEEVTHPIEARLKEKIEDIKGMGLVYDDVSEARARELLVRYRGNVERVVEILLRDD